MNIRKFKILLFFTLPTLPFIIEGCGEKNPDDPTVNIFSIADDKELGEQVKTEIFNNPGQYPILDSVTYKGAYDYVRNIVSKILATDKVFYKNQFAWETYIIHDDSILNAFCAPGGYIFVYTGLIKYLDADHELAGVMGHEIAHADRRHTTDQLTKQYGITVLLNVVFGNDNNTLKNIVANLLALKYSRDDESQADEYSVIYLCPTNYKADGAAAFFQKLIDEGRGTGNLEFLSTHPNPDNRVANIHQHKNEKQCAGTGTFDTEYQNLKNNLLP